MSFLSRCVLLALVLVALCAMVSSQSCPTSYPPYNQGAVCNGTVVASVYGIAMNKCAVQCCNVYGTRGCKFYNYLNVNNPGQSTCQMVSSCNTTVATPNAAWGTYTPPA